jgi:hypothetical protein
MSFHQRRSSDKPDYGNDRMNENEDDVVHAGIVSKSQKIPEFRPILELATDTSFKSLYLFPGFPTDLQSRALYELQIKMHLTHPLGIAQTEKSSVR